MLYEPLQDDEPSYAEQLRRAAERRRAFAAVPKRPDPEPAKVASPPPPSPKKVSAPKPQPSLPPMLAFNLACPSVPPRQGWLVYLDCGSVVEVESEAPEQKPRITAKEILAHVGSAYGLRVNDLVSARRTRAIVLPRQIAMYLCKTLTPMSLPEIGRRMGKRDHTTILYGVRKVEALMVEDADLRAKVENLAAILRDGVLG